MSHKQSARSKRIDVVIDCLMNPAWRMHTLGDPKEPACYLIRKEPSREVGPADLSSAMAENFEHRYWTNGNPNAKKHATFALKTLLAEQIVDALTADEKKADG